MCLFTGRTILSITLIFLSSYNETKKKITICDIFRPIINKKKYLNYKIGFHKIFKLYNLFKERRNLWANIETTKRLTTKKMYWKTLTKEENTKIYSNQTFKYFSFTFLSNLEKNKMKQNYEQNKNKIKGSKIH